MATTPKLGSVLPAADQDQIHLKSRGPATEAKSATPNLCQRLRDLCETQNKLRKKNPRSQSKIYTCAQTSAENEYRLRDPAEEVPRAEEEMRKARHREGQEAELQEGTTEESESEKKSQKTDDDHTRSVHTPPERLPEPRSLCDSDKNIASSKWDPISDPENPARILSHSELRTQRMIFLCLIALANLAMVLPAVLKETEGNFVLAFIMFVKAKDCISVIISAVGLSINFVRRKLHPPEPVTSKWNLTLIPAYSESEDQIVKAIFSLRDNDVEPHLQVMCVVLDGQPRDIKKHMTRVIKEWERPYVTLKFKRGLLHMVSGFIEDVPVLVIEKLKNAGKKDSLVLCHDLFNYPRENIPLYTNLLREEMWQAGPPG